MATSGIPELREYDKVEVSEWIDLVGFSMDCGE